MVFPVVGGDGKPTGYEIDNSLRVGSGRTLSRTFTAVTAERKKHTISCWIKLCILDGENHMLYAAGSDSSYIRINDDHMFRFRMFISSDDQAMFQTNRLFRDVGAWYHIVFVYDSAQGTDTDRTKLYVNGERITSFSSGTYSGGRFPDQNEESMIGSNAVHSIKGYSSGGEFYVADWYYIGNQALSPSDFGETNDNGVWVPKKYTGSFGSTNDTFLEFKQTGTSTDASGIGADTSGEGNHMASTNLAATDVTTDTPTNNFATLNSITSATNDLSEGNTVSDLDNGTTNTSTTQFSANGKWYAEFKVTDLAGSNSYIRIGVVSAEQNAVDLGGPNETYAFLGDGRKYVEGSASSYGSALNVNDIVMVALDTDNNKVWYGANGTWFASGDPSSNSNESHAIDSGPSFGFAIASGTSSASPEIQCNFGNPPFAISSGNADANGYGNFEYAVPTGFYALCTKNLAEYG